MTDIFDEAQALEQRIRDAELLAQIRRAGLAGKTGADSATECVDCDALIPDARRWAVPGCQRCVECASLHERKKGRAL